MSERTSKGCVLDARGCIDLESILTGFGAPISEEQAWALCYTTVQCFFDIKDREKPKVSLSPSLSHVILHKDGYVHQETLLPTETQGKAAHASHLLIQGALATGSAGCCLTHPACAGVLHQSIVCVASPPSATVPPLPRGGMPGRLGGRAAVALLHGWRHVPSEPYVRVSLARLQELLTRGCFDIREVQGNC
ncbi:hypothetical protein E2C01_074997 [Portunus trituberculatus]|uniref:KIND domain-containing protein n=1 Tax=Portunus trituberculatus TaxID=210409 RepID=A0A5B7IHY8_PORTR|nr:hypothetical protein [Portunus trituberculatus]